MPSAYKLKPCRHCGGEKDASLPRHMRGWYCEPCKGEIYSGYARRNSDCGKCASRWNCAECERIRKERQRAAARRGVETRRQNQSGYFRPFNAERWWQSRAHSLVQQAIKKGLLPRLKDGGYTCVDCGAEAMEYDHRDYGRPFDVDPVCRSCNKQRGTAIWPSSDRFEFAKHEAAPKRQKARAA